MLTGEGKGPGGSLEKPCFVQGVNVGLRVPESASDFDRLPKRE